MARCLTQTHKYQSSQLRDLEEQFFRLRSEMDQEPSELVTKRKDASELAMQLRKERRRNNAFLRPHNEGVERYHAITSVSS